MPRLMSAVLQSMTAAAMSVCRVLPVSCHTLTKGHASAPSVAFEMHLESLGSSNYPKQKPLP